MAHRLSQYCLSVSRLSLRPVLSQDAGEAFASTREGVFFFRSFGLFCTSSTSDGICSGVVPGTNEIAYTDTRHISRAGATYLWPHLCAAYREYGMIP